MPCQNEHFINNVYKKMIYESGKKKIQSHYFFELLESILDSLSSISWKRINYMSLK
jgi:hypothetical protein